MTCFKFIWFLVVATWMGTCVGVNQYVTLFTEQNQQGRNLTLDRHYANLTEHHDFLRNTSSFCAVGWIICYTNANYNMEGGIAIWINNDDTAPKCRNGIFYNYNSVRYVGNQDTDVPGVSLYSKANYHGAEVYVNENGTLSSELTFPVLSLATTGWANYTFFEGTHRNGTSWCLQSSSKVHLVAEVETNLVNIGSVSVGCNSTNILRL